MKLKSSVLPLFLLSCSGAYVQNQNISNGFMFDGEPFLAINPEDRQYMIATYLH